jgi:RluA family pseudouridine synthase
VFDRRIGVDASLAETESTQCFKCQAPLSPTDQEDARYVEGESCPHCYLDDNERMLRAIAEREQAIVRVTTPLPGSVAYDNIRPINISAKFDGQQLIDALGGIFPQLPPEFWQERFDQQLLVDVGRQPVAPSQRVRAGDVYLHRWPATTEPDVNAAIRVLYEDTAIVVIDKPAPLPLHPSGRFNRNTLEWILNAVYHPQKLRPIHRLDATTTGVTVFARTRHFARLLQSQFAAGSVEKVYLARIQGHPAKDRFICEAPITSAATELGARAIATDTDCGGQSARTDFQVLERFADGTALVEVRPVTGRTNQIRVHLWHLGWPVVGDQAYLANHERGDTQTHAVTDAPLCLHAHRISFDHPITMERVTFTAPIRGW